MAEKQRNLYLIGPMGSGKSAVGRQLARDLGLEFVDTDAEIERRTGVDIPYIFDKEGETGFREREKDVIDKLSQRQGVIVATGGGAVLRPDNRDRLKASGTVVYLHASVDEQLRRTGRSQSRPLLMNDDPRAVLERLMAVRQPIYEALADIRMDTTGRQVGAVTSALRKLLGEQGLAPLKN